MTTFELAKILLPVLFGLVAFLYYVAHLVEHGVSEQAIDQLRQFARKRSLLPAVQAAFKFFLFSADRYFGSCLFSCRALLRSFALSITWTLFVLMVCLVVFPSYTNWLGSKVSRHLILENAAVLLLASLLIDFASTCVTRTIVRAADGKGVRILLFAFALDLILSVSLFYTLFTTAKFLLLPNMEPILPIEAFNVWLNPGALPIGIQLLEPLTSDMLIPLGGGVFDIQGGLNTEIIYAFPEPVLFLSSLLTSIWLWLYLLASACLYLTVHVDRLGVWSRKFLNIDHSPVHALAIATFIAALIIYVGILVMHALYRSLM